MQHRFYRGKPVGLSIVLVLVLTVVSACGGGSSNKNTSSPPASNNAGAGAPVASAPAPVASAVLAASKDVNVALKDNVFDPKALAVPVGQDAIIHLKNTGTAIHNMHIFSKDAEGKDFVSAAIINPGESNDFTVHFTKKGTYKLWCDFHTNDMTGTITVQ
jgi:plastocyanin